MTLRPWLLRRTNTMYWRPNINCPNIRRALAPPELSNSFFSPSYPSAPKLGNRISSTNHHAAAELCFNNASAASSAGGRLPNAGPIMPTPSLPNRLPCTGQSQLFSALFQHTTPFICGQSAENLETLPSSSLYTAIGVLVVGFRTPPLPGARSSISLISDCRNRLYCALICTS